MSVVGGGNPSLYCIGQPCYGVAIFVAARVDLPPIHQSVPGAGCLRELPVPGYYNTYGGFSQIAPEVLGISL